MLRSTVSRRRRAWRLVIALLGVAGIASAASKDYSDGGAKVCGDCHGDAKVQSIMKTAHGKAEDPKTPAAQKECQSCHGPSAMHTQFPMQVENLHFGKVSRAKPEEQNQACLACHADGARQNWKVSAHGFEKVLCSTCHSIHDPARIVPTEATVSEGCSAAGCHDGLRASAAPVHFTHAVDRQIGENGQMTCAGCHNPHGPLSSDRCVDCHAQTPDVLARQSEKARRYHAVAAERGTECIRCHKALAHPIKPLALQDQQAARDEAAP